MKSAASLANHVVHHGLHSVPAPHHSCHAEGMVIHCWRGCPGGDVIYVQGGEAQVVDPGQDYVDLGGKRIHLGDSKARKNPHHHVRVTGGPDAGRTWAREDWRSAHAYAEELRGRGDTVQLERLVGDEYQNVKGNPNSAWKQHDPAHLPYYEIRKFKSTPGAGEPFTSYTADNQQEAASILQGFKPTDDIDVTRWTFSNGRWIGSPVPSYTWEHWEATRQNPPYLTPTYLHKPGDISIGYRMNPKETWYAYSLTSYLSKPYKGGLGPFGSAAEAKRYLKDNDFDRGPFQRDGNGSWIGDGYEITTKKREERSNPRNTPVNTFKFAPFGTISIHPPQPKNAYWNIYVNGKDGTEAHYAWHEATPFSERGYWSENGKPPERLLYACLEKGLPEEARNAPARG